MASLLISTNSTPNKLFKATAHKPFLYSETAHGPRLNAGVSPHGLFMVIQTPIGELSFSVSAYGQQLAVDETHLKHARIEPHLPPGMAVDSLEAVLVELTPHTQLRTVTISCKWVSTPGVWDDRPTGEYLDAQSWVVDSKLVLIGTEDLDSLVTRLTDHGLLDAPYPVVYCDDGFEIVLSRVPARQMTSLHFIVASNHYPEPVDCSAWYAVDVPHAHVRAAAGEG